MDAKTFLSKSKGVLIAPAGFGKTHFIADAFKHLSGKQLILTHTHAGVASIKSKLSKQGIAPERFQVETISSLAQRFAISFYTGDGMPEQDDKENYFPFVLEQATKLLDRKHISRIIKETYSGLFVDEYQDCTLSHHKFILKLADLVPTYFLGDYLQGIFEFNEPLVDLTCPIQMDGFIQNRYDLLEPNRWIHGGNSQLGTAITAIRASLEKKEEIDLSNYPSILTFVGLHDDFYKTDTDSRKEIWRLTKEKDVLIIHPISANVPPRKKFVTNFQNQFHLIEAIDDKDFYGYAEKIDGASASNFLPTANQLLSDLFGKKNISSWIKDDRLVKKKDKDESKMQIYLKFNQLISDYQQEKSGQFFKKVIDICEHDLKFPCYRREILWALKDAIEITIEKEIPVLEAMKLNRNKIRRTGRNLTRRCIGTTLLTKGLEFDTVAILNCDLIKCPKNFYVAISRARKNLIVFTNNPVLRPYEK